MRVLITGGVGVVGRAITTHLQELGWDIKLIDVVADTELPDTLYSVCDIMDFDGLCTHMKGVDAVIHMAAIPNPYRVAGHDLYRINTAGTFNVFEAAAKEGIKRVVQASSINAIGCAWNLQEFSPQYLPIDEDHPSITTDPYSFSKRQIEDIGEYFWRRDGISSVAFRFPGVYRADYYKSEAYYERRDTMRECLDQLLQLSPEERAEKLAKVKAMSLAYRAERPLEHPEKHPRPVELNGVDEILWRAYTFDRFNLWVFINERDAARAVEQAVTADYEGSHPLFVNDHHNFLDYDSKTLAELFFPEVTEWKQPITGSEALVSINRARQLINFEPEYSIGGL